MLPIRRFRERAQRRDRYGRDTTRAAFEKLRPLSVGCSAEAKLRRSRLEFPKFQPPLARSKFRARGWQAFQWRGARRSSSVHSQERLLRAPSRSYYAGHRRGGKPGGKESGGGGKSLLWGSLLSPVRRAPGA